MFNKKIDLFYREFNLGSLINKVGCYFWLPNSENISLAINKYPMGMDFFFLPKDKLKTFDEVPAHFEEFLIASNREDLFDKAKILDSDSDFERLFKMSKLEYFNKDFVIKS